MDKECQHPACPYTFQGDANIQPALAPSKAKKTQHFHSTQHARGDGTPTECRHEIPCTQKQPQETGATAVLGDSSGCVGHVQTLTKHAGN